jgi:hypothetical protein
MLAWGQDEDIGINFLGRDSTLEVKGWQAGMRHPKTAPRSRKRKKKTELLTHWLDLFQVEFRLHMQLIPAGVRPAKAYHLIDSEWIE